MTFISWRFVTAFVLAAMAAGFALLYMLGPMPPSWYPPCPLHALTGLWCPGCGSARLMHDVAHGDFRAACGHNILIVVFAPFLAAWGAVALWRGLVRNQPPADMPLGTARIVAVLVVVFMVARNLPWWPFTLLAPAP